MTTKRSVAFVSLMAAAFAASVDMPEEETNPGPDMPPGPKRGDTFHDHLDACTQCREHPFGLCKVGAQLLQVVGEWPGKTGCRAAACRTLDDCLCTCKQCKEECR